MLKNILFLLFCSIEPVIFHNIWFQKGPLVDLDYTLVWLFALCLWGAIFTLPRAFIAIMFVLQAQASILLTIWHSHFDNPLSLFVIFQQYREGLNFATKVWTTFLNPLLLLPLGFLIVQLVWLRYFMPQKSWQWRSVFYVPLLVLLGGSYHTFSRQPFTNMDFKAYTKAMGYTEGWIYELMTSYDKKVLIEKTLQSIHQPTSQLPAELQKVSLPNHIYLVQVESLDYVAYNGEADGQKIMPFLQSLAPQSAVYKVRPLSHFCSANADFSLMSKLTNNEELYAAMYWMLPKDFYGQFTSLPQKLERKGYRTSFFHGYIKGFYNREIPYAHYGFDDVYFLENMPQELNHGEMGIDDVEAIDFALAKNKETQAEKQFNFIITLSSHSNYEIALRNLAPHTAPKTDKEKYANAINYVDKAFEKLIKNTPEDSLYIFYSDHPSNINADKNTLLFIYGKAQNLAYQGTINFPSITEIVHGLVEQK